MQSYLFSRHITNLPNNSANLRIFPSPAYDKVRIEFGDAVTAEIYDFSGRKVNVVFRQCGSQCAEADISYLFPGLYVVRVKNRTTTKYSAFLKI